MRSTGGRTGTVVQEMARWAASLDHRDIPPDVLDLARAQRFSVLGGMAASARDGATRRLLTGLARTASSGPAPLVGTGRSVPVDDALYAACAASIALDFDDYLAFGHTGHSAVLVPLLLASEIEVSGDEQLLSQVVANEVEARLGGACLLGPLNGQMWSFIHAAGAALAGGRVVGLDVPRLAHALAIALAQPPRPTAAGFMGPDAKLLTAAEPTLAGLRAVRLAAARLTGPLDAFEHPHGFLSAFADAPLPGMLLAGLGESWATRTLCVKPYPGCAYLDTTLDALDRLAPDPSTQIDRIDVDAGMLTCGMDALSASGSDAPLTPVTVTFSVPFAVAVRLVGGEFTPRQLDATWLRANEDELRAVARRVRLRHDPMMTRSTISAFGGLVPSRLVAREAGAGGLFRVLRRMTADEAGGAGVSALPGIARTLAANRNHRFFDPAAVDGFAMSFPARVALHGSRGRAGTVLSEVPPGASGHPTVGPAAVARAKFEAWAPWLWGEDGAKDLASGVVSDDPGLWQRIASAPVCTEEVA